MALVYSLKEALALASAPDTNRATLSFLAGYPDGVVIHLVGAHPNTPADTLCMLTLGERWGGVLENPNAPAEALGILARKPNPSVKIAVANHPNTSLETLEILAHEPDVLVAYTAENARCARLDLPLPPQPVITLKEPKPKKGFFRKH